MSSVQNPSEILAQLDDAQQAAVTNLKGPLAIIAGAGSGKTRTISHRIAYGIATGEYAEGRVLALTYTNRAAAELRSRLRLLGAPGVQVRTFHAAALAQLQFFWPQLTESMAPKLVTQKASMVNEVLDDMSIRVSDQERLALQAEVEYLRYAMLEIDQYESLERPRLALNAARFVDFFRRYEQFKQQKRIVDWEDAILLTCGLLRNETRMLSHVQQQYRYFTVDEYQDISPLQQSLLETWLGERDELCVVGDPRQTIYSFAGATSGYLTGFMNRFPDASVIELDRNYRSSLEIVELANKIAPDLPLQAVRQISSRPKVMSFSSPSAESTAVAAEIQLLSQTRPLSSIAVLARTNSQLSPIEKELQRLGIESQLRGSGRFFRRPDVMQANAAIRALRTMETKEPLFVEVSKILSALGWSSQPKKTEGWEALNWFVEVLDELGTPTLDEYLRELDDWERSGHEPQREAVTLATIHGTKGLEWESVFLVGVNQGIFPIGYAQSDAEKAEERRLFYVAVTRAQTNLQVSFSKEKGPSEFIALVDNRN
ncbi:MAG: ATP-dependent helicase [Aquiluna sp.]|nr:ATP-dependent helicase [Aquiluna sp.]